MVSTRTSTWEKSTCANRSTTETFFGGASRPAVLAPLPPLVMSRYRSRIDCDRGLCPDFPAAQGSLVDLSIALRRSSLLGLALPLVLLTLVHTSPRWRLDDFADAFRGSLVVLAPFSFPEEKVSRRLFAPRDFFVFEGVTGRLRGGRDEEGCCRGGRNLGCSVSMLPPFTILSYSDSMSLTVQNDRRRFLRGGRGDVFVAVLSVAFAFVFAPVYAAAAAELPLRRQEEGRPRRRRDLLAAALALVDVGVDFDDAQLVRNDLDTQEAPFLLIVAS